MKKIQTNLKFLVLFGVLFSFVTFIGCNSDDENPDDPITNNLIGLWTISDAQIEATIGGQSLIAYIADFLGISEVEAAVFAALFDAALDDNFSGTIEFKANNTYITNIGGETDDGTWSLNSAGDKITLDAGTADEQITDIISLTATTLQVGFDQTEYEDIDDNEMTPDVAIDMRVVLTLIK